MRIDELPEEYRPLSMWQYFLYQILFSIPIIGFIFLIIIAFGGENINLRNFARSYFCSLIIIIVLIVIVFFLMQSAIALY